MVSRDTLIRLAMVLALLLSACERQPSVDALRDEVSTLLERDFVPGLFEIQSIRRMGSTPSRDKSTGDQRLTVYFNMELRFRKDYDLTAWDSPGAASLIFLLDATEKGIEGVRQGGNDENDIVKIHGSRLFALREGTWRPLLVASRAQPEEAPRGGAQESIARLTDLSERAMKRYGGAEQAVIDEELAASLQRIERKLDQLGEILSIASGPQDGAYNRYILVLENNAGRTGFRVRNHATQGSVENCLLVQNNGVDLAIAQSNITALALRGRGRSSRPDASPTSVRCLHSSLNICMSWCQLNQASRTLRSSRAGESISVCRTPARAWMRCVSSMRSVSNCPISRMFVNLASAPRSVRCAQASWTLS